ncbi:hypothetical protein E2320_022925, partial [Naja naja]
DLVFYKHLFLFNTDYKFYTNFLANQLKVITNILKAFDSLKLQFLKQVLIKFKFSSSIYKIVE